MIGHEISVYRSHGKNVEIGVRREANRSQVGHLARICDKVWRQLSAFLLIELVIQDAEAA
jgi:hypothetical protein